MENLSEDYSSAVKTIDCNLVDPAGAQQLEQLPVAAGCSAQLGKTADFRRSFYFQFPAGCDLLWTENGCGGDQCNSFEYYVPVFAEIHCAKYRSQRNQAVILYQSNRSAG